MDKCCSRLLENASVQKQYFFSKFSGGSDPRPLLLDFQAKDPPQVHDHHHYFSFLANLPNICMETVKDYLSLMQLGVTRPLFRLGLSSPKPETLRTWLFWGTEKL